MSALHSDLMAIGVDIVPTLQRFDDNEVLLVRCLKLFARDDSASAASDALEAGNFRQLESIAHSVKGTSVNVGLADLSARWDAVLQAVREERFEDVDGLTRSALEEFHATQQAINALP